MIAVGLAGNAEPIVIPPSGRRPRGRASVPPRLFRILICRRLLAVVGARFRAGAEETGGREILRRAPLVDAAFGVGRILPVRLAVPLVRLTSPLLDVARLSEAAEGVPSVELTLTTNSSRIRTLMFTTTHR